MWIPEQVNRSHYFCYNDFIMGMPIIWMDALIRLFVFTTNGDYKIKKELTQIF